MACLRDAISAHPDQTYLSLLQCIQRMAQVLSLESQTKYRLEAQSAQGFIKMLVQNGKVSHGRGRNKVQWLCFPALN